MKLAFYKAKYGDKLDKAISLLSHGEFSHCEFIFPGYDNVAFSSSYRDNGVRFKQIDFNPDRWEIIDLAKTIRVSEQEIANWCQCQVGCKYDIIGAILQISFYNNRWYCSEICSTILQYFSHIPLKRTTISPTKLYYSVKNFQ